MSQRRAGTRGGKEKGSPQEGRICTNAAFELLGRMPRDMSEQAYMLGILFFFFYFYAFKGAESKYFSSKHNTI